MHNLQREDTITEYMIFFLLYKENRYVKNIRKYPKHTSEGNSSYWFAMHLSSYSYYILTFTILL